MKSSQPWNRCEEQLCQLGQTAFCAAGPSHPPLATCHPPPSFMGTHRLSPASARLPRPPALPYPMPLLPVSLTPSFLLFKDQFKSTPLPQPARLYFLWTPQHLLPLCLGLVINSCSMRLRVPCALISGPHRDHHLSSSWIQAYPFCVAHSMEHGAGHTINSQ